jgi:6,7-dimethyl-8-ribityllumazine synthase
MNKKILILWSDYYKEISLRHLEICLKKLSHYPYAYSVEQVEAGTYELPAVIQYFHRHNPYDGYLPLSLLLKGQTDHYEFIWQHIKDCFTQFTLQEVIIGNGIITAPSFELLEERVNHGERAAEAVRALDYLLRLQYKSPTERLDDSKHQ